jgi:hypothetical protein
MRTLVFHSDAGHGWLAVRIRDVISLEIADQISSYSYQRGATVYLEEDADMRLFVQAAAAAGFQYQIRQGRVCDRSPVRGYERWSGVSSAAPETRTVISLMSGQPVTIAADTPLCCDPSSETYWSM